MFENYPGIAKTNTLKLNSDCLKLINDYLPRPVWCDECEMTVHFNDLMDKINESKLKKPIPHKVPSDRLKICSECNKTKLCPHHYSIASIYAKKYTLHKECLCNACCWNNIG